MASNITNQLNDEKYLFYKKIEFIINKSKNVREFNILLIYRIFSNNALHSFSI